jgi:hypothetical protein
MGCDVWVAACSLDVGPEICCMIELIPWRKREFTFDLPVGAFPTLLERLRGTPARAEDLVRRIADDLLSGRVNGKWSVKEHLGHLVDLELLDDRRLGEYLAHVPALSPADMGNRATESANHREKPMQEILGRMREARNMLAVKLERLGTEDVAIEAIHPRLQKPMRLLDWVYFVAEHDDHHLAHARKVLRELIET